MEEDFLTNEMLKNYRGKYSQYWIERFGLIPNIPTNYDNANSIYELLAWLQRAFKSLLDDFLALESEFTDFKNAFTELLEYLIPELIRRWTKSKEAHEWFTEKSNEYFNSIIKPYVNNIVNELESKISKLENKVITLEKELEKTNNKVIELESKISKIEHQFETSKDMEKALLKIINNLEASGAWTGGLKGGLNPFRNIATGNINIYGGTPDGDSFIKTTGLQNENDLAMGV